MIKVSPKNDTPRHISGGENVFLKNCRQGEGAKSHNSGGGETHKKCTGKKKCLLIELKN